MIILRTSKLVAASFVATAVLSSSCGSGAAKPRPMTVQEMIVADPLPLAQGARWNYKVTITKYDPTKDTEVTSTMDWASEVVGVKTSGNLVAYTVRGWPSDLIEFEGTPVAKERTILRSGNHFLWTEIPEPSLDKAEGWFSWPVMDGQKICPDATMAYCWQVSAVETGYALTYYTGPDEVTYELSPGTGVSRFYYSHHGTTNSVEAKLVGFSKGS